jgi:hydroxymethylpyrimidine/phosphomethylpyrimidine kinase
VKRLLIVAGSDSGGGAGIQADLKTASAFGVYGMTAITAITVQNTRGVCGVQKVAPETVAGQIEACLSDIGADAIKTGMLVDAAIVAAVAGALEKHAHGIPLVLDPVMVATSGDALISDDAVETMAERLFPRAALVTPNLPEARRLTGLAVENRAEIRAAGEKLIAMGAKAALIKGGHGAAQVIEDVLVRPGGEKVFTSPRIDSRNTHGTGCTLATAIACGLAEGRDLAEAVARARSYVRRAIAAAPDFGGGHGPLNHMVAPD